MKPQAQEILNVLSTGETLTTLKALFQNQCFSLSARIAEIKKTGIPVKKRMIKTDTGKNIAEYYL